MSGIYGNNYEDKYFEEKLISYLDNEYNNGKYTLNYEIRFEYPDYFIDIDIDNIYLEDGIIINFDTINSITLTSYDIESLDVVLSIDELNQIFYIDNEKILDKLNQEIETILCYIG